MTFLFISQKKKKFNEFEIHTGFLSFLDTYIFSFYLFKLLQTKLLFETLTKALIMNVKIKIYIHTDVSCILFSFNYLHSWNISKSNWKLPKWKKVMFLLGVQLVRWIDTELCNFQVISSRLALPIIMYILSLPIRFIEFDFLMLSLHMKSL